MLNQCTPFIKGEKTKNLHTVQAFCRTAFVLFFLRKMKARQQSDLKLFLLGARQSGRPIFNYLITNFSTLAPWFVNVRTMYVPVESLSIPDNVNVSMDNVGL